MKKILFILTAFIFSFFSLSAQWTCETLDPEFDDALKIAYTEMNNRAKLMIGEYMLMEKYEKFGSQQLSGPDDLWDLIDIGEYDKEEMEERIADYRDYSKENQFYTQFFDLGNIPIVLEGNFRYYSYDDDYYAVYSFEVSFKLGEIFKKYKSENDFYVSYKYDRKSGIGCYYIEWPSKEFWRDFRAASSVKIRIKHNRDSDYQYYEFNMSGSSKAFNYVTAGHRVVWMEDVAEEYGNYLEDILVKKQVEQLRRIKVREAEEVERQKESTKPDWQSEYEAEKQRYMASHTPPHELKLECKSRHLSMEHPHFELYPLSNSVICDSRYDFFDVGYDTILNMLNLCPCLDDQISDIDMNHELYSKSFDWNLDGIHILGNDSKEIVVPFESIPQYKWDKRYCASLYFGDNAALWGTEAIDSLEKYQLIWTQNPLKLIVKEHDKTLEFVVQDWGVDGEWMHGNYNFNWYYRVLSEYGEEYVVSFNDYVVDSGDIENDDDDVIEYFSNIGNVLLFDHWKNKIPANIFFRHTDLDAFDVFEIKK